MITYSTDTTDINWPEAAGVLYRAPLGQRRDPDQLRQACLASYAAVFAFDGQTLVGMARAISDGIYQAAVYDMVVLPEYQGQGIGREIMKRLSDQLPVESIILYAVPGREGFYSKCGFRKMLTAMAILKPNMSRPEAGYLEQGMAPEKPAPWYIRAARPDEANQIKAVAVAAYSVYIERIGKPPAPMLDDYSDIVKRHPVFVAEQDNTIVGILVLMPGPESILMDNVAILPSRQGQGLGRALITFAETYAREHGYPHLDLYTNELMHENIRLYKSLNYVETRRVLEKGYHRIYMHKDL